MTAPLRVLGISGSLRRASFNSGLVEAARELAPEGMAVERFDLEAIPPYSQDLQAEGFPPAVADLRAAIAAADALVIATPEYNFSFSGVLKNAIDWASRPPEQPFAGKPVGLCGASPSRLGTARAQYHLRQVFVFLDCPVMMKPELMVSGAGGLFDETGALTDAETRRRLGEFLAALAAWARRWRESA